MKSAMKNINIILLVLLILNIFCNAQVQDSNIRIIQFNRIGQQETIKKSENYRIIYGVANPENTRIKYKQSNNNDEYILELVYFEDLVKAVEEPNFEPDFSEEEVNRIKSINDSLQNVILLLTEKIDTLTEPELPINDNNNKTSDNENIPDKTSPDESIQNMMSGIGEIDSKINFKKAEFYENVKKIETLQEKINDYLKNNKSPEDILILEKDLNELMKRNDTLLEERDGLSQEKSDLKKQIDEKIEKVKKQEGLMIFLIIIIVLIMILAIAIFINYRSKKKANILLRSMNDELEDKNKKITDSIEYALKIQQAVLTNENKLDELFSKKIEQKVLASNDKLHELLSDYFVLFKPKSVVSGDFYWVESIERYTFVAVVDCTGHGVPGAFMSLIGNDLLNQIIKERKIFDPAKILHELHVGVRSALNQKDVIGEQQDGMETCLVMINDGLMTFAGAKRPLWYVKNNEFFEIKGNKKPIGGRQKEKIREFDNHVIKLDSKITIYLTSDGFADQNDPNNKSYTTRRLKSFITNIADKNMSEQCKLLNDELNKFSDGEPNRDDITILGFKLSPIGEK